MSGEAKKKACDIPRTSRETWRSFMMLLWTCFCLCCVCGGSWAWRGKALIISSM